MSTHFDKHAHARDAAGRFAPRAGSEPAVTLSEQTTTYASRDDAVRAEIIEPLGEHANDFDADAMADELLTWHDDTTPDGDIDVTRSGFRCTADADTFWDAAARHGR